MNGDWWSQFCGAAGADAFDYVFSFFGDETLGDGDGRYGDIGETDGLVAASAREMHMTETMASVVVMAYAIFLCAAAVVDVVE